MKQHEFGIITIWQWDKRQERELQMSLNDIGSHYTILHKASFFFFIQIKSFTYSQNKPVLSIESVFRCHKYQIDPS